MILAARKPAFNTPPCRGYCGSKLIVATPLGQHPVQLQHQPKPTCKSLKSKTGATLKK
ncbi:MAG: hypothetical protein ABI538_09905 [Pseudoxanthomonas sp.]